MTMKVHNPLTPPIDVVPGITQPTSEALVRAMAKDPAERYLSYDELIMALTAARSRLLVQTFTRQTLNVNENSHRKQANWRWWRW